MRRPITSADWRASRIEQRDKAIADYKLALAHDRNMSEARRALVRAATADERIRRRALDRARSGSSSSAVESEATHRLPRSSARRRRRRRMRKPPEPAKQVVLPKAPEMPAPKPLEINEAGAGKARSSCAPDKADSK